LKWQKQHGICSDHIGRNDETEVIRLDSQTCNIQKLGSFSNASVSPKKSRYILVYYIIYIYIYTYIYIIYVYIYIHNYIYIMYVIMKYIYMYIVFFHPRRPFRRAPGGMGHQAGLYSGLVLLRLPDAPSTRRASRILWHECHQEWCP